MQTAATAGAALRGASRSPSLAERGPHQFRRVTAPASEGQVPRHAYCSVGRVALRQSVQAAGSTTEVTYGGLGGLGHGNKRPWLQAPMATCHQHERPNDEMQQTSGGSGARLRGSARHFIKRRLLLISVFYGRPLAGRTRTSHAD